MSELNPDFRTVDEVEPDSEFLRLPGWTDGTQTSEAGLIDHERRTFGAMEANNPAAFQARAPRAFNAPMLEKWNAFQKSKGRYPGSCDWSLLDEFFNGREENGVWIGGDPLLWKPQIIGSCVMSNTFRAYVIRQMIQIILYGDAQEYLGRNEYGPRNFAPYGPYTYGVARKKANMRGGDGLYCAPMAWALMQGVLPCNVPALTAILNQTDGDNPSDYPEPQGRNGAALYRAFGKWQYIDDLRTYADFAVEECPEVKSASDLWDLLTAGKPSFVCSMEAIHKVGTHPDGFPIHARNPRDSWAHNMAFHGTIVASDGERFIRQSNESWGAQHIYNRRFSEVDQAFRSGRLTCRAIGQIAGPSSAPPSLT